MVGEAKAQVVLKERALKKEVFWLLLLILCVSLFHWRGLQPGHTFLPVDLANNNLPWRREDNQPLQNVLISDPLYQFYPFLNDAVTTVRDERQWPLWNPNIMLGHPTLGDPLAQPFFPLLLVLGLVAGVARGFTLGLWLLAIVGAFLTYGWLRVVGCRQLAAFVGAITYALSGYMVTWFETAFWLSTLALLPGILLAFELARQKRSLRYLTLAALLFGLAILGGQFQFIIIFVIFLGLYALGRALASRQEETKSPSSPILIFVAVVVLGLLLGSVLLLPAAELLSLSRRVVERGSTDSLPWRQWVTLIVPNFYGTPTTSPFYWGTGNFSESTIYVGLVSLLLACLAPFTHKRFFTIFLAGIVVIVTYYVVGGPGVTFLSWVPGLKYASLHRTIFILPLLIAYLAAQTLNAPAISFRLSLIVVIIFSGAILVAFFFLEEAISHWNFLQTEVVRAAILLVLALTLIWIAERFPNYRGLTRWGIAGLVFVDLFLYGSQFNPAGPIEQLMPPTASINVLRNNNPQRVVALQRNDEVLFGPNVLSLFSLASAGGYSSLIIDRYHQLVSAADPELDVWWMNRQGNMVTFSSPTMRLLDLFQVSHVVSPTPIDVSEVRTEIANDDCLDKSNPISSGYPISDSFTIQETAINRLDFHFLVDDAIQAKPVDFVIRLWQGAKDGQLVLEEQQTLAASSEHELVVVYFSPEKYAPGKTYYWEVSTDAEDTGVTICLGANGQPAVSVRGSDWSEIYREDVFIYERLAPMPRAYVVYAAEHINDEAKTVQRLLDENFPIRNKAITVEPVPLPTTTEIPATRAFVTDRSDTKVLVRVNTVAEGLLILGDQFYPGWQVTVDGQPAMVHRVNHIFRGVLISPGEHEVAFEFKPQSLRVGIMLSMVGVLLITIIFIFDWRIVGKHASKGESPDR